jgi:hypothetical protein
MPGPSIAEGTGDVVLPLSRVVVGKPIWCTLLTRRRGTFSWQALLHDRLQFVFTASFNYLFRT